MNHKFRLKAVSRIDKFKPIFNEYNTLYMESRKARYYCTKYNQKKVKDILETLTIIEKKLTEAS